MSQASSSQLDELAKYLGDRLWRLNNLYKIVNKDGEVVTFQMNWAQKLLLNSLWFRNVDLKGRQLGISTFYLILWLDTCLFIPNTTAVVIAHTLPDAQKLFRDKVRFPYNNLPDAIRRGLPLRGDRAQEFEFANGSSISVGVSARGGTPNVLHVTEFGYICAKHPKKAHEIKTGAMQAVPANGITVVESTAMGAYGDFHDMCQEPIKRDQAGGITAPNQYRLHFLPWWKHPEYTDDETTLGLSTENAVIRVPAPFVITANEDKYLDQVQAQIGRKFTRGQRVWYCKKWRELGEDIKSEYPSTPAEAFAQSVQGAYYADQMRRVREAGGVGSFPHHPGASVETYWDIGHNDATAIWFLQWYGAEPRAIDYHEETGGHLATFVKLLNDKARDLGYVYGRHVFPHDIEVTDYGSGETRLQRARALGLANVEVAPRIPVDEGIDAVRHVLPMMKFDEARCDRGIKCLDHYRKEWNPTMLTYSNTPLHDWASNGADALRYFAVSQRTGLRSQARARPVIRKQWA